MSIWKWTNSIKLIFFLFKLYYIQGSYLSVYFFGILSRFFELLSLIFIWLNWAIDITICFGYCWVLFFNTLKSSSLYTIKSHWQTSSVLSFIIILRLIILRWLLLNAVRIILIYCFWMHLCLFNSLILIKNLFNCLEK